MYEEFKTLIRKDKNELLICSLSSSFDNQLLWSYYANGYNGVCIEIEIDAKKNLINKVNHNNTLPILDKNKINYANLFLTNKSTIWKHEKEYRLFSNSEFITTGIKIKAIYFGVKINKEDKRSIISKMKDNNLNIKMYNIKVFYKKIIKELLL